MEVQGKITKILPVEKFVSKKDGNEFSRYTFILETSGQYPKHIAFTVMGDEKFKKMNIVEGRTYNISFDVSSRQWKERWFTEVSAWNATPID